MITISGCWKATEVRCGSATGRSRNAACRTARGNTRRMRCPTNRPAPSLLKQQLEGVARLARGEPYHLATLADALNVQEIVEGIHAG